MTLSVRSRPHAGHLAHLRLAAELAFGADLAGHARHLGGEDAELLDHRVDDGGRAQELALQRAAVDVEAHGLQQVALRHRGDGVGHFGRGPQEIVDQRVERLLHLAPGAAGHAEFYALARLALLADRLADALQLLRHALIGGNDLVEDIGELADGADMATRHAHGKIADAHRLHGLQQVVQLGERARYRIGSAVADPLPRPPGLLRDFGTGLHILAPRLGRLRKVA